jgi:Polysaccharide pyruvyl transferase
MMAGLIDKLQRAVSRPRPGVPGLPRRPRVAFMTTVHHNVGDEFIREGIRSFLDEVLGDYDPFYVHKHDLATLKTPLLDEGELLGDKFRDADIIVQAGAPVYWVINEHRCYSVEWAQDLWYERIFKLGPDKPVLNIGAGVCQADEEELAPLTADAKCVDFAQQAGKACRWTSVRDPLGARFLAAAGVEHELLPCPAFHAARRVISGKTPRDVLAVNLMKIAGHHVIKPQNDPARWWQVIAKVLPELRDKHTLLFVAHDAAEAEFQRNFARPGEMVFLSPDYRDYLSVYGSVKGIFANRVHGAVCVAGFGRPAVIVGTDSRIGIGRPIGIPVIDSSAVTPEWIIKSLDEQFARAPALSRERLDLRESSARVYVQRIRAALAPRTNGQMNGASLPSGAGSRA